MKKMVVWFWLFLLSSFGSANESTPLAPERITIVATGDFHGALDAGPTKVLDGRLVGGIDIIAAYVEALRETNPAGVVLLDAGDVYQGTLLSAANEGKAAIDFYNELGYDAMAVGNHEFDFGPVGYHSVAQNPNEDPLEVIKLRARQARFPFLGANIYDRATQKRVQWKNLKSYKIIKRKGIKIAIIGLSSVSTPITTHPANIKSLEFKPLLETVRDLLPKVRAEGATVVILLAHAGVKVDEETGEVTGEVADLARQLGPDEVDLIVGGHTHTPFAGRINDIPIVQCWPNGISFARADLVVERPSRRVIRDLVGLSDNIFFYRESLTGGDPTYAGQILRPSRRFEKKLAEFRRSVAHLENIVLGTATRKMKRKCPYDSPLGNLITDAIRASDQSIDVAMYNAGAIRADIPQGAITFGRLYEVVPFDNNVVTLKMTGAQIREAVEQGLTGEYGAMQISGLQVVVDTAAPPKKRCMDLQNRSGQKLEEQKLYKVATNEFVVKGGDGYTVFAKGVDIFDTKTLIREVVAQYIKAKKSLDPVEDSRYHAANDNAGSKRSTNCLQ